MLAKPNRAFTLVEQVIAVALFALMTVSVYSVLASQTNVIRKSRERVYVARIIDSRIEELRELTFDELNALPSEIDFTVKPAVTVFDEPINDDVVDEDYEMTLSAAEGKVFIDSLETDLKQITVRISWDSISSQPCTMEMATYITRSGISRK